jgi:hypothetical protein
MIILLPRNTLIYTFGINDGISIVLLEKCNNPFPSTGGAICIAERLNILSLGTHTPVKNFNGEIMHQLFPTAGMPYSFDWSAQQEMMCGCLAAT